MKKSMLLRRGSLVLLFLVYACASHAQTLPNYGFTNVTCAISWGYMPSITHCLPGWSASHGLPHLDHRNYPVPGDPTPTRVNTVHMYQVLNQTDGNRSDGMYAECYFPAGNSSYELTFDLTHQYQYGFGSVSVSLATNLVPNSTASFPQVEPTTANVVWTQNVSLSSIPPDSWITALVNVVPPTAGTYQVWIRPDPTTLPGPTPLTDSTWASGGMFVTNVRFSPPPCPTSDVFVQNNTSLPTRVLTQGRITAGQAVTTGPQGPVVVQAGQTVEFAAHTEVALLDGFSAVPGALFDAHLIGLGCAYPRPARVPPTTTSLPLGTSASPAGHSSPCRHNEALSASPNPANEYLQLPAGIRREQAVLYNGAGVPVHLPPARQGQLDVRALPQGLYLLYLTSGGTTTKQRIQIIH